MKRVKKSAVLFAFVLPAIIGFIGYLLSGRNVFDSTYYAIKMYFFDADTTGNNIMIELGRWTAPVFTASGLLLLLKTAFCALKNFFKSFYPKAVAVYGDNELKKTVLNNIKYTIDVKNDDIPDVKSHIIMFSEDEKSLKFYKDHKNEFSGEVFIKIDKNDSYTIAHENIKFFNPCEIIARDFWIKNDISGVLEKETMKIVIIGSDLISRKILTYGLMNNIYSLKQKIEYHIWSDNDIFKQTHSDFKTMNSDTITYHGKIAEVNIDEIADAERIIITDNIDNEFLGEVSKIAKGEIFCFNPLGTFVNIFNSSKIKTFGSYEEILTEENIKKHNLYDFAKKLNYSYTLKYMAAEEKEMPTVEEAWEDLDVFSKGSNIASTDYHHIMQLIMNKTGKKNIDNTLAELEHIRWCRYHFINHWKFGQTANGKKDTSNKIHPCLRPFDELSDTDKEKDIDGIRTLAELYKTIEK